MPACSVKWCKSHTDMKNQGLSFHTFPRHIIRAKKWVSAVRLERNELDWMPSKTSKICSIHFCDDDNTPSILSDSLNDGRRKRLKNSAVPVCTMVRPLKPNVNPSCDLSEPSSSTDDTNIQESDDDIPAAPVTYEESDLQFDGRFPAEPSTSRIQNVEKRTRASNFKSTVHKTKKPVVYTTKLDDMFIWDKILKLQNRSGFSRVLSEVDRESRPKPTGINKKPKGNRNRMLRDFDNFKKSLSYYNYVTTQHVESEEETKKQMKKCNDINTKQITTTVIKVETSGSLSDVYFVDSNGTPTLFYRDDNENRISLTKHVLNVMNNCCWYEREERIKISYLTRSLQAFMRIPHSCQPENCTCCCKIERQDYKTIKSSWLVQALKGAQEPEPTRTCEHRNNKWHQRLLHRYVNKRSNNVINAALAYTPKAKDIYKEGEKQGSYRNTSLKLQFGPNQTRGYWFDNDGIINMVDADSNTDATFVGDDFQNELNICCLSNYKIFLTKLTKEAHPTVVKFLMNKPFIGPFMCSSCENVDIRNDNKAKVMSAMPIPLPKCPKHTTGFGKIVHHANVNTHTLIDFESKKTGSPYLIERNNKENSNTSMLTERQSSGSIKVPELIEIDIEDIKLFIHPGGKVKIHTKTLPENISTDNLVILREIIRCAENSVYYFNLNPVKPFDVPNLFTSKPPVNKEEILKNPIRSIIKHSRIENVIPTEDLREKNPKGNIYNAVTSIPQGNIYNAVTSIPPVENENSVKSAIEPIIKDCSIDNVIPTQDLSETERKGNIYNAFTSINMTKRNNYLTSYARFRSTKHDLRASIHALGKASPKDSYKRKAEHVGNTPNLKQIRKKAPEMAVLSVPSTSKIDKSPMSKLPLLPKKVLPDNTPTLSNMMLNVFKQSRMFPLTVLRSQNPSKDHNPTDYAVLVPNDPVTQRNVSVGSTSPLVRLSGSESRNVPETQVDKSDDCILGV